MLHLETVAILASSIAPGRMVVQQQNRSMLLFEMLQNKLSTHDWHYCLSKGGGLVDASGKDLLPAPQSGVSGLCWRLCWSFGQVSAVCWG